MSHIGRTLFAVVPLLLVACANDAGTAVASAGSAGVGGAAASTGGSNTGGSSATGGAVATGGTAASTGGSSNGSGGGPSSGGSSQGGATAAAGASGRIWYDGEPSGVAYSNGNATLSSGSTASETASAPHSGSHCLEVKLNAGAGWAHFGWQPTKSGTQYDLSGDTAIDFWIRDAAGAIGDLQMEMHGPGGGCPWVHLADHLATGGTSAWQKVSIPLSAFQLDRSKIQTLDFWLTTGSVDFFIDDGHW